MKIYNGYFLKIAIIIEILTCRYKCSQYFLLHESITVNLQAVTIHYAVPGDGRNWKIQ